jgi:hypothetical protein
MRESRTYGFVRGALSNMRPYGDTPYVPRHYDCGIVCRPSPAILVNKASFVTPGPRRGNSSALPVASTSRAIPRLAASVRPDPGLAHMLHVMKEQRR